MPYMMQGVVREKEGNSTVEREHDNPRFKYFCLFTVLQNPMNDSVNLLYFRGQGKKPYLQTKGDMRHDTDR